MAILPIGVFPPTLAAATATARLRLGLGVLIVPLREPAWIAKDVATLQHLSGDRATPSQRSRRCRSSPSVAPIARPLRTTCHGCAL